MAAAGRTGALVVLMRGKEIIGLAEPAREFAPPARYVESPPAM
jgi:hypothetical protein